MRLLSVLAAFFIFLGCSNYGEPINFGAPKFPAQLCADYDPASSFLLTQSSARGIQLNELYYGLLDGVQIGLIVEAIDKEKVRDFMDTTAEWYKKHYPISYTTLVNYLVDTEKAQAVSAILSRRIGEYHSNLIISKYDDCLLKAGWSNAMDELYLR